MFARSAAIRRRDDCTREHTAARSDRRRGDGARLRCDRATRGGCTHDLDLGAHRGASANRARGLSIEKKSLFCLFYLDSGSRSLVWEIASTKNRRASLARSPHGPGPPADIKTPRWVEVCPRNESCAEPVSKRPMVRWGRVRGGPRQLWTSRRRRGSPEAERSDKGLGDVEVRLAGSLTSGLPRRRRLSTTEPTAPALT